MKNFYDKKCACSINPCLHMMKDNSQDLNVNLVASQVPKMFEFFQHNILDGTLKITFNSIQQKQAFTNFMDKSIEKNNIEDFETSFVNFQPEEDEEPQTQTYPSQRSQKLTQELALYYPFNYMMRIVEFYKHTVAFAQKHHVDLQMGRNAKKNLDLVQSYITSVIDNCEHKEIKKQRWEAIAINNTRSIINKLNQEKIGFTKIEDNHDFFKLYFFWKKKTEKMPEIIDYIQNSCFVSIKMIKNKKIQKLNLNQDQNKLMNIFAELKTKLFQRIFKPNQYPKVNFEMKIDDKNQIFNRFIYHFSNEQHENSKITPFYPDQESFKLVLDNQINQIVYFGLVVKNQEFHAKKHPLMEFSEIEKIGNLNLVGFAFDLKSLQSNQTMLAFLNQLDICGIIFDNFKWKLSFESISEMKSFNLKNIKFVQENQQSVQLHGLISNETNQPDFWKRIIFYIIDMSEKNQKQNKQNNMFDFANMKNHKPQNQKVQDESPFQNKNNIEVKNSYKQSNFSDQFKMNDFFEPETNQVPVKQEPDFFDDHDFKQEKTNEKKSYYDNLFEIMDNYDHANELSSPYLKFCNKQDQERITLQMRNITKRYQITDIFKNFNQELFESYNDLKDKHEILDVMVILQTRKNNYTLSRTTSSPSWTKGSRKARSFTKISKIRSPS